MKQFLINLSNLILYWVMTITIAGILGQSSQVVAGIYMLAFTIPIGLDFLPRLCANIPPVGRKVRWHPVAFKTVGYTTFFILGYSYTGMLSYLMGEHAALRAVSMLVSLIMCTVLIVNISTLFTSGYESAEQVTT